jgi:uncharacterized membrane protein
MAFIDREIEVAADIRDVYALWVAFEDFPKFMAEVERVDLVQADATHWVAVVEDEVVEWDADIVQHELETLVKWEAVDGRETGEVKFEKRGDDRTAVQYKLEFDAGVWDRDENEVLEWMEGRVENALEAFKALVEAVEAEG